MSGKRQALKARYIFPVSGPPIEDGMITIADGRIVAVGKNLCSRQDEYWDWGNVAIVPGLVNAHTHLEFSGLRAPLGTQGMSLPDWIRLVIAHRRASIGAAGDSRYDGLGESTGGGATSVGEIATSPWPEQAEGSALARRWARPEITVFWEVIGLSPDQFQQREAAAEAHLNWHWPEGGPVRPGLSPHAPYSVHPELLDRILRLAKRSNVPVAMHLAESREELELLASGTGPFRRMLEDLGVWSPEVFSGGWRPLDYLKRLADAPRVLVIHGNYLDREEIDFLADHRAKMSLVYCPRTHAYFRHERYPLAEMLQRGVDVAFGTDSRASNPDLNMRAEMHFAAHAHPGIPPAKILELATLAGARSLGTDAEVGTLEPGKLANVAIVGLPARRASDPHELLMDSAAGVVFAYHRPAGFYPSSYGSRPI